MQNSALCELEHSVGAVIAKSKAWGPRAGSVEINTPYGRNGTTFLTLNPLLRTACCGWCPNPATHRRLPRSLFSFGPSVFSLLSPSSLSLPHVDSLSWRPTSVSEGSLHPRHGNVESGVLIVPLSRPPEFCLSGFSQIRVADRDVPSSNPSIVILFNAGNKLPSAHLPGYNLNGFFNLAMHHPQSSPRRPPAQPQVFVTCLRLLIPVRQLLPIGGMAHSSHS